MTTQKPTPGPWTFYRWDEGGYTRFYIAQQEGAPYTPDYSDVASMVCETVSGERVAVQEANARLIAAAPDLLKVLEIIAADSRWTSGEPLLMQVRAAIAKATGI